MALISQVMRHILRSARGKSTHWKLFFRGFSDTLRRSEAGSQDYTMAFDCPLRRPHYLGRIFLDADNITRIKELCGDSGYLCRGIVAIIPSLLKTITRAAPFLGYAILSAVLYGIFIFAYGVRHGGVARNRFTYRPWQILLFFIGSVWLLFTTLSYWTGDQGSFHQVIEPQPGIYENMSESTLSPFKVNFQRLKDAGCLSLVKQLRADVGEYSLSGVCMQGFFIS